MRKDAIRQATFTVTNAEANIGTQIPQNHNRYIYRLKWINLFNGLNTLTFRKSENGGVPVTVDTFVATLLNDQDTDPEDGLKENSAPLYTIGGTGTTGTSFMRAVATQNTMQLTIWYEDAASPS